MTGSASPLPLLFIFAALAAAGCVAPVDPTGGIERLCVPEGPECGDTASLEPDRLGRNLLDMALTNTGPVAATVRLSIWPVGDAVTTLPEGDTAGADDAGQGGAGAGGAALVERRFELAAGETAVDRIVPEELGSLIPITVVLDCEPRPSCQTLMEYVWLVQPAECTTDGDCPGGWVCQRGGTNELRRCVECYMNDEEIVGACAETQTCDAQLSRCVGPVEEGCAVAAAPSRPAPRLPWLALALVAMAAGVHLVARRRMLAVWAAAASIALVAPAEASAQGLQTGFSVGVGPRFFTGQVGALTETGLGVSLAQELRWGWLGLVAEVEAGYFLTTQRPPPLSNELQTYGFSIGPRLYLPLGWRLELALGPDYERLGLASNSLVRVTGPRSGFHGLGGAAGARLRWERFELRLELAGQKLLGLETTLLTLNLGAALVLGGS